MSDGWLMDAVEACWDRRLFFECVHCRERLTEDDLEQSQPDGRYVCPLGCGEDLPESEFAFVVIPYVHIEDAELRK